MKVRLVVPVILLIIAAGAVFAGIHHKQNLQNSTQTEEKQEQAAASENGTIQIGICNQTGKARDADIWILPDNQANRKTTSWGTASAGKLDVGNRAEASAAASPDGCYLIRMMDAAGLYYEANGILLQNGETVVIKDGGEAMSAVVEVQDAEGKVTGSYDMFVASL